MKQQAKLQSRPKAQTRTARVTAFEAVRPIRNNLINCKKLKKIIKFLLEFYQRVRCDIKLVLNCDIKKRVKHSHFTESTL